MCLQTASHPNQHGNHQPVIHINCVTHTANSCNPRKSQKSGGDNASKRGQTAEKHDPWQQDGQQETMAKQDDGHEGDRENEIPSVIMFCLNLVEQINISQQKTNQEVLKFSQQGKANLINGGENIINGQWSQQDYDSHECSSFPCVSNPENSGQKRGQKIELNFHLQ